MYLVKVQVFLLVLLATSHLLLWGMVGIDCMVIGRAQKRNILDSSADGIAPGSGDFTSSARENSASGDLHSRSLLEVDGGSSGSADFMSGSADLRNLHSGSGSGSESKLF